MLHKYNICPRCSLYGAGHDDPPGHWCVPPVSDHHPGLPALRHAAEVHVEERLALATHDMWLLRGIQRHGRYLVTPLGDLHNLINVRIPSEIEPRKDQFSIYFNLQRIWGRMLFLEQLVSTWCGCVMMVNVYKGGLKKQGLFLKRFKNRSVLLLYSRNSYNWSHVVTEHS